MCISQLSPAGAPNWAAVYTGDGVMMTLAEADPAPATITPMQQISEIKPKRRINDPPALDPTRRRFFYETVT
jgi:hypothetical protein